MGFKVSRQTRGVVALAVFVWAVIFLWKLPGLAARWDLPVQHDSVHATDIASVRQVDFEDLRADDDADATARSKAGAGARTKARPCMCRRYCERHPMLPPLLLLRPVVFARAAIGHACMHATRSRSPPASRPHTPPTPPALPSTRGR